MNPNPPVPPARAAALPGIALALLATAVSGPAARAQTQSLAFTGGVLLNTAVRFSGLGPHPAAGNPGPPTGAAASRTYDDGFNRVDATGNIGETTANWGYTGAYQLQSPGSLVLSQGSALGTVSIEDTGSFIEPSAHMEYRGSLGPVGNSDWGLVLGVGYQTVGADESATFVTDATVLSDAFSTLGTPASQFPPPPYSGSATGTGFRVGSQPSRTQSARTGGRVLSGKWEFDAELIPICGGLYFETQIAGRLNAVFSAGVIAALVNAELRFRETSTIDSLPSLHSQGADGTNDYFFGGFAQMGLDWALWESASLVASARWQPMQTFDHSVSGRTAEIDFSAAFAVHAGIAFRF